jgi:uncharacterized phiE125 gp8 family phage protein
VDNPYSIQVLTPPTAEPISVQDVADQLRLGDAEVTAETPLLTKKITRARTLFENLTQSCVMTTTVREYMDRPQPKIYLMRYPVQQVLQVQVQSDTGWVADTTFNADTSGQIANVYWKQAPPPQATMLDHPRVRIDYTVGWTPPPELVLEGITLMASHLYLYREPFSDDTKKEMPYGFQNIVDQYKLGLQWGTGQLPDHYHYVYPYNFPFWGYWY